MQHIPCESFWTFSRLSYNFHLQHERFKRVGCCGIRPADNIDEGKKCLTWFTLAAPKKLAARDGLPVARQNRSGRYGSPSSRAAQGTGSTRLLSARSQEEKSRQWLPYSLKSAKTRISVN
eukprot:2744744-Amphidinium_carterae.1